MLRHLRLLFLASVLIALPACGGGDDDDGKDKDVNVVEDTGVSETGTDTGNPGDTSEPKDTGEEGDTAELEDTGDDEDTSEMGDTGTTDTSADTTGGDTGMGDTGMVDTGPDCSEDTDGDGLDNCEEKNLGTDPDDGDTDGDGLSDFEELQNQTDPLKKDSDGDGAHDKDELDAGLDPNAVDSFGDGKRDGKRWRLTACENPQAEPVAYRENQAGNWRIALPPAFEKHYSELTLTNAPSPIASAVYEDPTNEVFGYLLSKNAESGQNSPVDALRNDVLSDIGSVVGGANNIIQDSTGGEFDTHGRKKAARGRYLVRTPTQKSARKLREELLIQMAPFPKADVKSGLPSTAGKNYSQFRVFVSVIFRANTSGKDQSLISVSVAPASSYDARDKVKFRMDDLTNTTNISEQIDGNLTNCATFKPGMGTPKAEFYWVLDQSGSMNDDNTKVKNFANKFVQEVGNTSLDFRLGVTNMDKDNKGRLFTGPGWTTSSGQFANAIQNGVIDCYGTSGWECSGGSEHGLESAKLGISYMLGLTPQQPTPKEAIRSNAQVITIFMSDEEDNSVDEGNKPVGPYKQFFKGRTIAFSITGNDSGCGTEDGKAYKDVAVATSGKFASLCAKDLTQTIRDIIFAATGLASNYTLPQTPISSSIQVYLNGNWVPRSREDGFEYFAERNSIAFFGSYRPSPKQMGPGDFVAVSYEYFVDRCKETGNGAGNCSGGGPTNP